MFELVLCNAVLDWIVLNELVVLNKRSLWTNNKNFLDKLKVIISTCNKNILHFYKVIACDMKMLLIDPLVENHWYKGLVCWRKWWSLVCKPECVRSCSFSSEDQHRLSQIITFYKFKMVLIVSMFLKLRTSSFLQITHIKPQLMLMR